MVERTEFFYGLNVRARNMLARLYINGAPVTFHASLDDMNYDANVEQYLRTGENTIILDYDPVYPVLRTYTPTEDMQVYMELDQRDAGTRFGKIDLFHGRYNTELQTLQAVDQHLFTGEPLRLQSGALTAPQRYEVAPFDMNYPDRPTGEFSNRLTIRFQIDDPGLMTPPREGAQTLTDTPELRDALYEAYLELHTAFVHEDVATYGELLAPVLNRFGYTRGFAGREDEVLRYQLENNPLRGAEGETLCPLASRAAFQNTHLSWGADMRMVAVSDSPIMYLNANGEPAGGLKFMFCKNSSNVFFSAFSNKRRNRPTVAGMRNTDATRRSS